MILKGLFGAKENPDDWFDDEEGEASSSLSTSPEETAEIRAMAVRAEAFSAYNARKINTIISKLGPLDDEIFQMLPALVHLNLPELPGYIEDEDRVPTGIVNYRVEPDILRLIQKNFSGAKAAAHTPPPMPGRGVIYSLAVMGSLATIAQTAKSDFDIWVCIEKPEFEEAKLEGLAEKLSAIEEWAEKKNHFECHFFITNISDARENRFGSSDTESAGSALGKLLKEEFFRTHTVLAGFPPFWDAVPPHISDEDYQRLRAAAADHYHLFDVSRFIDLGNAQRITMAEAFGAALWQLNKALGSPFKSAMKMALIEDYMDPESEPALLCDTLKETIVNLASTAGKKSGQDSLGGGSLLDDHPDRFL
ncbi:MAG: class I adenylate cyclase, partial [bacterium]